MKKNEEQGKRREQNGPRKVAGVIYGNPECRSLRRILRTSRQRALLQIAERMNLIKREPVHAS